MINTSANSLRMLAHLLGFMLEAGSVANFFHNLLGYESWSGFRKLFGKGIQNFEKLTKYLYCTCLVTFPFKEYLNCCSLSQSILGK